LLNAIIRKRKVRTTITTRITAIKNKIMMDRSGKAKTTTGTIIIGIITTSGNAMIITTKIIIIIGIMVAAVDVVVAAVVVAVEAEVVDVVVVVAVVTVDVAVAIVLTEAEVVDTKARHISTITKLNIKIRISHRWDRYSMIIIIMVAAHVEDLGPISLALPDGCRPTMVMAVGVNRR
jgi:hypothetical protein